MHSICRSESFIITPTDCNQSAIDSFMLWLSHCRDWLKEAITRALTSLFPNVGVLPLHAARYNWVKVSSWICDFLSFKINGLPVCRFLTTRFLFLDGNFKPSPWKQIHKPNSAPCFSNARITHLGSWTDWVIVWSCAKNRCWLFNA